MHSKSASVYVDDISHHIEGDVEAPEASPESSSLVDDESPLDSFDKAIPDHGVIIAEAESQLVFLVAV